MFLPCYNIYRNTGAGIPRVRVIWHFCRCEIRAACSKSINECECLMESDLYFQYGNKYVPHGLPVLWSRTVFSRVLIEAAEQSRRLLSLQFLCTRFKGFLFCFLRRPNFRWHKVLKKNPKLENTIKNIIWRCIFLWRAIFKKDNWTQPLNVGRFCEIWHQSWIRVWWLQLHFWLSLHPFPATVAVESGGGIWLWNKHCLHLHVIKKLYFV